MEIIEIEFKGENYAVHGTFDKGEPERRTQSNGDPGLSDGTPPSFWIEKVFLADTGTDVSEDLTTEDFAEIEEIVLREYEA